jgi:hypothetical protein
VSFTFAKKICYLKNVIPAKSKTLLLPGESSGVVFIFSLFPSWRFSLSAEMKHRYQRAILLIVCIVSLPVLYLFSNFKLVQSQNNYKGAPSRYDNIAIALKTGKDVALDRTSIQLLTFLSEINNLIVIGEAPGIKIGKWSMVDVYTNLYEKYDSKSQRNDLVQDDKGEIGANNDLSTETVLTNEDKDLSDGIDNGLKDVPEPVQQKEVVPDQISEGWTTDAHKNLPGYKHLYDTYPDAEWFVMIDDDTYLFMENLQRFLSSHNPDGKHYFGSATSFRGCGGVKEFSDEEKFAHGGSGIVLSRGALKEMILNIDQCILKERYCWAGDVRLALCLRDLGILVKHHNGFNNNPPNENMNFFSPCIEPTTFHHLVPSQIQELYDFEMEAKSKYDVINMGHVANYFLKPIEGAIMNVKRFGGDMAELKASNSQECLLLCQTKEGCVSFSFVTDTCYMKQWIPRVYPDESGIEESGIVLSHYICKTGLNGLFQ